MYFLILLLIVLLVLLVVALVLAERFLAARNPRHMARSDLQLRLTPRRTYRQPRPIEPIAQLMPSNGEPPVVSRATEVVRPEYILQDAQHRRS